MTQQAQSSDPVEAAAIRGALVAAEMFGAKSAAYQYGQYLTGYKHDTPAGGPITVGYRHGPGGNLSFPGVDMDVFSTVVGNYGLLSQLPAVPSVYSNPTFAVITGVGADSGSEKDDVCDDAVTAGLISAGVITSVYGRYERQTPELEINRLGVRNDRSDPVDLRLIGGPISQGGPFANGPGDPTVTGSVLDNEVASKFWELGISLARLLARQVWRGNPANNSAGGGYKEMTGLDVLINTGYKDAVSGISLPSVDSDLKDFNYLDVEDNGAAIVDALTWIYYTRRDLAIRTGMGAVRWVFVMRPELFHVLTTVWPCAYYTYQCSFGSNDQARVNIDGTAQSRLRDDMMAGSYLLIDGQRIEVIQDDGITAETQTDNGNVPPAAFSSSIYLVPMSVQGGRAVTYLEYMDFGNPSVQSALAPGMLLGRAEGPWFTVPKQNNFCFQFQTKIEPRLILRTPWLAGKLQHVVASPLQRTRSPFPDDPYFSGAGATSRPGPSYYSLWQS